MHLSFCHQNISVAEFIQTSIQFEIQVLEWYSCLRGCSYCAMFHVTSSHFFRFPLLFCRWWPSSPSRSSVPFYIFHFIHLMPLIVFIGHSIFIYRSDFDAVTYSRYKFHVVTTTLGILVSIVRVHIVFVRRNKFLDLLKFLLKLHEEMLRKGNVIMLILQGEYYSLINLICLIS